MPTALIPPVQDSIILGASGNCLDILDCIIDGPQNTSLYSTHSPKDECAFPSTSDALLCCAGFLDDDAALQHHSVQGLPVLGPLHSAGQYPHALFVNGIGNARHYQYKEAIIRSTLLPDERFIAIVSPLAHIARSARIGRGTVILSHSCVAAQAVLGAHVMILQHCIVNHDCIVEDFATLAAGVNVAGGCHIGKGAYIGSSACIRGGIQIGEYALVGMGAVVTKNVPARATVVGNPAKIFNK